MLETISFLQNVSGVGTPLIWEGLNIILSVMSDVISVTSLYNRLKKIIINVYAWLRAIGWWCTNYVAHKPHAI